MLLTNRKTLLTKQIDIENEVRGTLRVFGGGGAVPDPEQAGQPREDRPA